MFALALVILLVIILGLCAGMLLIDLLRAFGWIS